MKRNGYLLILLCLTLLSGGIIAGSARYDITHHLIGYDPRVYGPYMCITSCTIGTPSPDPSTLAYINSIDAAYVAADPEYGRVVGDDFIICNALFCATYRRTAGLFQFLGMNRVPQYNYGGGGGNGGGGPGGSQGGLNWGIVGYTAIYKTVQTCTPQGCQSQSVLIGYEPVYGIRDSTIVG